MKKTALIISTLLFSLSTFAQPAKFHQLFHTYKGEEGVVALRIPGVLIKLAGCCAGLDHGERELLRSLRSVSVLTIEDADCYPGVNFAEEINPSLQREDYKLMLKVHEDGEHVIIAAREKKGRVRDLIVVVGGEENVLVHVKGRMKSDMLKELGRVSGIDRLELTAKI